MKKENLDIIQVYRGIASLMVAVFHFWIHMSHVFQNEFGNIRKITSMGAYGVDFFFVLSGFIISYSYLGKTITVPKYLTNRYLRIYVPYIPLGILFAIGYTIFRDLSFVGGVNFSWLATLTLLPFGNTSLVVAWSLVHEIIFYFAFVIAIYSYKKYNVFLIIWSILIVIYNLTNFTTNIGLIDFVLYKILHLYNFEFMLGYLCFLVIDQLKNIKLSFLMSGLCLGLFLVVYFIGYHSFIIKLLFSGFSFWLIVLAYQFKDFKLKPSNFFMQMGNYSYSLYLIHIPVQIVFFRVFPHTNIILSFLVGIIITLVVSYIYCQIFEKKVFYYIKNKLKV